MLYNLEDTIAAISTPPGRGATGIIRISGPLAVKIVENFFSPSGKRRLSETPSHTIVHGWITASGGSLVDEVMVSLMLKPHSYTGEDTVEVSAHAGPVILERILKLSVDNGARLAGPGEFTFRAYVNGKLDLAEAEAVADLIGSKTGLALETALSHLNGRYSARIQGFRKTLVSLLASLEASLDHSEEGIEFISRDAARQALQDMSNEVSKLVKSSRKALFLREGLKIAIIGKPNAGKSSLLNALLERERAIVADTPGTTRDVLEEAIEVKGFPVVLMDTAGIRKHSQDPVENQGQNRTLDAVKRAQVVLWVLDSSSSDIEADRHIAETMKTIAKEKLVIPVWNKSDLPLKAVRKDILGLFHFGGPSAGINVCALYGTGIEELENAVVSAFSLSEDIPSGALTANARHIEALTRAETAFQEASGSLSGEYSEEITALHLREAIGALGEITGEAATDEILEHIFKNFCVGK